MYLLKSLDLEIWTRKLVHQPLPHKYLELLNGPGWSLRAEKTEVLEALEVEWDFCCILPINQISLNLVDAYKWGEGRVIGCVIISLTSFLNGQPQPLHLLLEFK